ncbi:MAG: hypothetical protein AAF938_30420 [Myxococcota bacterium]
MGGLLVAGLLLLASLQMGCTLLGAAIGGAVNGREGARRGAVVGAHLDVRAARAVANAERDPHHHRTPVGNVVTYRCVPDKRTRASFYRASYRIDAVSDCNDDHGVPCDCERISR